MKRIILFRFHRHPLICINRLRLLRSYNPDIPIYGLYGGRSEGIFYLYRFLIITLLKPYLKGMYCFNKVKSGQWKWQHGDLVVNDWFRNFGCNLDFDAVYVVEWDMLVLGPIEKIYNQVGSESVSMTGLTKVSEIEKDYCWTGKEPFRGQWLQLLEYMKENYRYNDEPVVGQFGGSSFSRKFLERYSQLSEIPEWGNDEVRLPLFVQALGYKIENNGIVDTIKESGEKNYFNADLNLIQDKTILNELGKSDGKRIFHPYRKVWSNK